MNAWLKTGILIIALLAFGAARLSYESGLHREFRAAGLMVPRLDIGSRGRIGQTSSAVALAGLRTLVATFLNLRAYTAFTDRRWGDVEQTFDTMVDLAPHTRSYWDLGSWHLAYNAASYYLNDSKLPPLRRREAWRSHIWKGRAFMERGIANNPNDWRLLANLGLLLTDPNKFPAFRDINASFAAAAECYQKSADTGKAPGFVHRAGLYALARVAGKEAEALRLARELYAQGPKSRTPTLRMLLFVLEAHENPSINTELRALELLGPPEKAYAALAAHWQRSRERFPVFGVSSAIEALEKSLSIPKEKSLLGQALPPPPDVDDGFRN